MKRKRFYAFILVATLLFAAVFYGNNSKKNIIPNPIDEYFLPRIEAPESQANKRELQDTYKGVWKAEFENIVIWTGEDLAGYVESIESIIDTIQSMLYTEETRIGNGTRSEINQKTAEVYRDAGLWLIKEYKRKGEYVFRDIDYSKEHYE